MYSPKKYRSIQEILITGLAILGIDIATCPYMDNVHNIDFTQTLDMHVIANIPISSHIRMCTNNKIAVLCAYLIGPIARPGARGLGPGLGLTY